MKQKQLIWAKELLEYGVRKGYVDESLIEGMTDQEIISLAKEISEIETTREE